MDLLWSKPLSDGGSSIVGYLIEQCRKASDDEAADTWTTAVRITGGNVTNHTVADLEEGSKYSFRVKAQNRVGHGKPSHETPFLAAVDARGL